MRTLYLAVGLFLLVQSIKAQTRTVLPPSVQKSASDATVPPEVGRRSVPGEHIDRSASESEVPPELGRRRMPGEIVEEGTSESDVPPELGKRASPSERKRKPQPSPEKP